MNKEKSLIIASVLGISGGILLLYGAILPVVMALMHVNKVSDIWQIRHLNLIFLLFLAGIIFGMLGIIGSIKVKTRNSTAGIMMLISAFGIFGGINLAYMSIGSSFGTNLLRFL